MTELTVVTFGPTNLGIYINGKLEEIGEPHMEGRLLRKIMESDTQISETNTEHYKFREWVGMPNTLKEAEEMYGDS